MGEKFPMVRALIFLFSAFLATTSSAQSSNEEKLVSFLKHYFKVIDPCPLEEVRYFHAFTDLNGDGKEDAIVLLVGGYFCGTGGCPLMILSATSQGFKLINITTIVQPPVCQLTTSSHGWKDLAVTVCGGGVFKCYKAKLRFNGNHYPRNPSVPPAIKTTDEGTILIPDFDSFESAKILR